MPIWPACALGALAAACAYPAMTTSPPQADAYRALGQEPGWNVAIADGRMTYIGDYGETRISVPAPEPRPTVNGLRYETERLTIDITYARCNDSMSGHGYEHQVLVIADGEAVRGCGGERRPDWDV